jgi:hypothetical protein
MQITERQKTVLRGIYVSKEMVNPLILAVFAHLATIVQVLLVLVTGIATPSHLLAVSASVLKGPPALLAV